MYILNRIRNEQHNLIIETMQKFNSKSKSDPKILSKTKPHQQYMYTYIFQYNHLTRLYIIPFLEFFFFGAPHKYFMCLKFYTK